MHAIVRTATAVVVLTGALPPAIVAQSAAEIVERMLSEYERRSAAVENFSVIQDVMGLETVSYFEKEIVNGRPVFRLRHSIAGGMEIDSSDQGGLDAIYAMGDELARRARYEGRTEIGGYDVHVLEISDLTGMGFGQSVTPDSEFAPTLGRIFLDVDTYAPRRLEFQGEITNEQGVHEVNTTLDMGDYREVEGMLVAYRTVFTMEGLGAVIDPETRARFEQMQRELEDMPAEQRRMLESMMAGQLDQFRAMMSDDDAPMTVELIVREVVVNAGPPRY